MSEFVTLGELLIDFTPAGEQDGRRLFMCNAGGAVANVAAAISGFGVSASFMGMVGRDAFGEYLAGVLRDRGVDVSGLAVSDEYPTTLAFVHLSDGGERDFSFYRKPGADIMYTPEHINRDIVAGAKVFHFGSLSLTDEPARSATFEALALARQSGAVISYDPNYRAPLWKSPRQAREMIEKGMEYADILKISGDEAAFLFGDRACEDTAKMLTDRDIKLGLITLGSEGALYANAQGTGRAKGFKADAIDTTGAGDCFMAGVLSRFIRCGKTVDDLALCDIAEFTDFACAAASICVEGRGGISSMPGLAETQRRMKTRR